MYVQVTARRHAHEYNNDAHARVPTREKRSAGDKDEKRRDAAGKLNQTTREIGRAEH